MDIGVTNIYASTYAMKKAIDMPKLMLNLVQQIPSTDGSLNTESIVQYCLYLLFICTLPCRHFVPEKWERYSL